MWKAVKGYVQYKSNIVIPLSLRFFFQPLMLRIQKYLEIVIRFKFMCVSSAHACGEEHMYPKVNCSLCKHHTFDNRAGGWVTTTSFLVRWVLGYLISHCFVKQFVILLLGCLSG